jgi:hypothetical protein
MHKLREMISTTDAASAPSAPSSNFATRPEHEAVCTDASSSNLDARPTDREDARPREAMYTDANSSVAATANEATQSRLAPDTSGTAALHRSSGAGAFSKTLFRSAAGVADFFDSSRQAGMNLVPKGFLPLPPSSASRETRYSGAILTRSSPCLCHSWFACRLSVASQVEFWPG